MYALKSADLQDSATERLASQSDEPDGQRNLKSFSGKLNVDKELKLSRENFEHSVEEFYRYKDKSSLRQLRSTSVFPTPHVLAQFASKAYTEHKRGETDAQYETRLDLPTGWKLLTTASNNSKTNGYFGAAYWHPERQQVVIAHRGTYTKSLGALWTDIVGVWFKHHVPQMCSASTFAYKVVEVLRKVKRENQVSFQLFFTGHSLGGWLAQVTTFTTEYLKKEENIFLTNNNDKDCYHPHTVVFESPGCKDMLSGMRDTFDVRLDGRSIDIELLDITSYLSAPNRINTCNAHVGTVYRIFPDLSKMGWWEKYTALYNLATHSMDKIVEAFDHSTGQVYKDEQGKLKAQVVVDWPVSDVLEPGKEYKNFFEWAKHLNNYHPDIKDIPFQHLCQIRYQTKIYDERVSRLNIFSQEEREFLQYYHKMRQWPEFCKPKELFAVMKNDQAQEHAEKILQNFEIENDKIHCADGSALQELIPYVKRLLQLFPEIKEFRNLVYQCETSSCIKQMKQSPIDFKPNALSIREFLKDKQQQFLQVQMVDGDEWTGLMKVYQVLRKTNCLREGQYTVLKLERLLTLNMLMDFRTLMLSIKAPYLILMACETNQLLKAETKDMIRTIFETMKQNHFIKIIFTTRTEDRATPSLLNIIRDKFGNAFVTKVELLNWSDLTSSSQEKLLEKSVKFQDANISLKEIMSAESAAAKFLPLGALLDEKELKIADPVPNSNGYDESYYIGRTLRHGKNIKREIFSDKDVNEKNVFLVSTEEEYKQLCQLYPNNSVYWLDEDNTGKLVWRQSHGSLETLRRYIDTDSSHRYTADDVDKLLEQAEHQRVTLISDTAGMGKSTILTHLSKQIKQKFPAKWVVRIDLNDHTDALMVLKKEQIDKEKAIGFVLEEMQKTLQQEHIDKKKAIEFVLRKLLKLASGTDARKILDKGSIERKAFEFVLLKLLKLEPGTDAPKELKEEHMDKEKAIEFLWKEVLKLEPNLEIELFKQCCDRKQKLRIVVILDGFDEICPFYKQTVIDLLQGLRQTAVEQLWVTTRPHLRNELEDKLQQLSYTLEPFCEENQLEFLRKVWSLKDWFAEKEENNKKLEIYAEHLIKKLAASISDKDRKFAGIPIQTRLLAEAFDEEVKMFYLSTESMPDLPFKLELLGLYGRFIDRKYDIYQEEKLQISVNKAVAQEQRERDLQIMKEDHQVLALKVLLTEEQGQLFQNSSQCTLSVEELTRIGIVQVSHDGKLHFIHRTFAEYYVADCLVNRLTEGTNISELVQTFILKDIFQNEQYQVIRAFIDGLLSSSKKSEELLKQYGKQFHYLGKCAELMLHRAAKEGNGNIVAILLESLQASENTDTMCQQLLAQDNKGKTAYFMATERGNIQVLKKLWEFANKNLTTEEMNNKLLLATDKEGMTAWHRAAYEGKLDTLLQVWEWAEEKLKTEEINNKLLLVADNEGMTAWHRAACKGKLDILLKVYEWAEEKLTREEMNNKLLLAMDNEGMTAWHRAAYKGMLGIMLQVWEWAEEKLTREEINNKMLLATNSAGKTILHDASKLGKLEILQKLWEWIKEKLTAEEINKKMLLATDNEGMTAWHRAAYNGNLDVLLKMWEWAEEKLTREEINNELLLATDNKGMTAWHWAAYKGELDILLQVSEWAEEKLTRKEINNKLLLATDNAGMTFLHDAAKWGKLEILQKIWETAEEKLASDETANKLLLATDNNRMTAWQWAAKKAKLDILLQVWEWAEKKLTREEMNNKLLLATNNEGMTGWHIAAYDGNLDILLQVWEWAEGKLTGEEMNIKLLLATDNQGMTAWHWAAYKGRLDILLKVWEWAEKKLSTDEINNKLLLATDNEGMTVWHYAAYNGRLDILLKVQELVEEKLTTEEINTKLLLGRDNEGKTAFHDAVCERNVGILWKIWEWAEERLTTEETTNKLLLATDNEGMTAWHWVINWGNLDLFEKVWEWAEENLSKEEVTNKLLLGRNNAGMTTWHWAAYRGKVNILLQLWNSAEEKLTTEEINNKLLLATDSEGMTAWHRAAYNGKLDILLQVWEWAERKLTIEEINNKLLLATDKEGWTALHEAIREGNLDVLLKIWEWAEEKLTREELNNKLLLTTDNAEMTAWHWAAIHGNLDILLQVWEWAEGKLTTNELNNKFLMATDNEGMTAWHWAACEGNLNIFLKIWDWAEEKLTTEDINNKLLLATDNAGMTAWHWAAYEGKLDILLQVWKWAEQKKLKEEIICKLLLQTDIAGMTAWHRAAYNGKLNILLQVWEWAEEKLTREELNNKFLLATDKEGWTALHEAICGGNSDVLQKIWKWAEEKLTKDELSNKLLLATDNAGMTAWHWAAYKGKAYLLQQVWEWAKEKLTTEEINNILLLAIDKAERTAWHRAAYNGKPNILLQLWEWAEEKLIRQEMNTKLLLATDKAGMTAWHWAAYKGKLGILLQVWEWAEGKLTREEINNNLLLATDKAGMTAWHWAAYRGKLDILRQVWEWAEGKLTREEINNKLLLAIDNAGMTAWYRAAYNVKLNILLQVWEWAEEKLTKQEINNNFLLATDNAGLTVWQWAEKRGKINLKQKLWELAEKNLTTEEIKNKFLQFKDRSGMTAWH